MSAGRLPAAKICHIVSRKIFESVLGVAHTERMTDMVSGTKTKKECEGMEEVSLAYQKEGKKGRRRASGIDWVLLLAVATKPDSSRLTHPFSGPLT